MIGLIATLRINEGKAELFEDIFREVMDLVRAQEPGCLVYQLTKSREAANLYRVLELYQDQAALDAHSKSDELRDAFARLAQCLHGRPEIEYLDGVV